MYKLIWENTVNGRHGEITSETIEGLNVDYYINKNIWGLPARWLPEELEGVETREVIEYPAQDAYEYEELDMDGKPTGNIIQVPATEATYRTEYLYPAEYTYEIISETLEDAVARKAKEFSDESIARNGELKKWNAYRCANVAAGVYDEATAIVYKNAYINRSEELRNEYYRLVDLLEACTTVEDVEVVKWTME